QMMNCLITQIPWQCRIRDCFRQGWHPWTPIIRKAFHCSDWHLSSTGLVRHTGQLGYRRISSFSEHKKPNHRILFTLLARTLYERYQSVSTQELVRGHHRKQSCSPTRLFIVSYPPQENRHCIRPNFHGCTLRFASLLRIGTCRPTGISAKLRQPL